MFVHLTYRTKIFVHVRSFTKRTNMNELPAERFMNFSLNVQFVYSPSNDCVTGCYCQVYITDRALHARVNSRLCHSLPTPVAWNLQFLPLMSTRDYHEDSTEEMSAEDPDNWGDCYPEEGQMAADALTGYVTLFWDFFCADNFRLPVTNFFLEFLEYYKIHISQLHPIGMVRVRHFEFVCRTMHIKPTVPRFPVFHEMHCSQEWELFI
ncbi:hypothetical protein Hanom_Chr09g00866361 [Helianthus anomalus]